MSEITLTIDGKLCVAKEGESVLNVARRNGIFIPALCYLNNCSPTLACRLCLADVDGKRAYTCNAKVKEGMVVVTKSEEIEKERRAIMEVYDINHPLECGVCDQSGECELQNYTLEMGVDSQSHCIADTQRPSKDWGFIHYDASLCIVCERCITVCKDMIGDSALKTVPRGGAELDKEWKEKTQKDAYAMWNKMQKSIVGLASGGDTLECSDCGECTAVCPVGALVGSDFQYSSNAWELKKIPASNPHSSDCSLMYYDVKHTSTSISKPKIYRVSSEYNYAPLHGGARYGYDFQNEVDGKDEEAFDKAVAFLKNEADTIAFSSYITNEEAFILQKLKEKYGYKLINPDAYRYQTFLKNFTKTSGKSLYSGDLDKVRASNFVVSLGGMLRSDSPNAGYAMNNALSMNKGAGIYFHPIGDKVVSGYSKNILSALHVVGAEEAIVYLLLDLFADKEKLPASIKEYLADFHTITKKTITDGEEGQTKEIEVDTNALLEIIGLEEDFCEKVEKLLDKKDTFSLIVGEDVYTHKQSANIAKLLGLLERTTPFDVLLVPSKTNTLGVALICDLSKTRGHKTLGYNEKGDFTLCALGKGDLDMPALNQQEGTFSSMNKRVVPTNVAVPFDGYCLNDIANALDLEREWTVDYTAHLPKKAGFKAVAFDSLPNEFDNAGNENRGYLLEIFELTCSDEIESMSDIKVYKEPLVYRANPINQFSPFTNKAHQLNEAGALYASQEFVASLGLKHKDMVKITNHQGDKLVVAVMVDSSIEGMIPYLPTFDRKIDVSPFFKDGYRFAEGTIKGVSHE